MFVRLLLILTLVWQPVSVSALAAPAEREADCETSACCRVIETTTCCGLRTVERVCSRSGGECRCGYAPQERDPAPKAPAPQTGSERTLVPAPASIVGLVVAPAPVVSRPTAQDPRGAAPTDHQRALALLGVWRT